MAGEVRLTCILNLLCLPSFFRFELMPCNRRAEAEFRPSRPSRTTAALVTLLRMRFRGPAFTHMPRIEGRDAQPQSPGSAHPPKKQHKPRFRRVGNELPTLQRRRTLALARSCNSASPAARHQSKPPDPGFVGWVTRYPRVVARSETNPLVKWFGPQPQKSAPK